MVPPQYFFGFLSRLVPPGGGGKVVQHAGFSPHVHAVSSWITWDILTAAITHFKGYILFLLLSKVKDGN